MQNFILTVDYIPLMFALFVVGGAHALYVIILIRSVYYTFSLKTKAYRTVNRNPKKESLTKHLWIPPLVTLMIAHTVTVIVYYIADLPFDAAPLWTCDMYERDWMIVTGFEMIAHLSAIICNIKHNYDFREPVPYNKIKLERSD